MSDFIRYAFGKTSLGDVMVAASDRGVVAFGSVASTAGKISMGARREVVSALTERYRSTKRAAKGRILDALCATTGWHRKHAVRALRQHETVGPDGVKAPRERRRRYGAADHSTSDRPLQGRHQGNIRR
jgi:hypothetical protein